MGILKSGAAGCLVAPLLAGCVSYSSEIRREVTRGDLTVAVERARQPTRKTARVDLTVTSIPPDVRLVEATLSHSARSFCGGPRATDFGRAGGRPKDAPLVKGERFSLEFETVEPLEGDAPHLDLLLGTPHGTRRCVSVPLTAPGRHLSWETKERFTVGVDIGIEGFSASLGPVATLVSIPVELGVWFGRYHLEVGAGPAGAGCRDTACPVDSDKHIDYSTVFPVFAGVRYNAWESGEYAVGVDLRYRAAKLAADTFQGRETYWMQGPVIAPYVAAVMPVSSDGSKGGAREALIGLDVPLGYAFAENGKHAFSFGVNLALFFTAF